MRASLLPIRLFFVLHRVAISLPRSLCFVSDSVSLSSRAFSSLSLALALALVQTKPLFFILLLCVYAPDLSPISRSFLIWLKIYLKQFNSVVKSSQAFIDNEIILLCMYLSASQNSRTAIQIALFATGIFALFLGFFSLLLSVVVLIVPPASFAPLFSLSLSLIHSFTWNVKSMMNFVNQSAQLYQLLIFTCN